ncbi:MAG: cob(I)yrinic acid a,c-diamide adenosyltransferase [Calditrichia bacterium]
MVRITRVYTKTGDEGMTSLAGGQRVEKTAPRIVAYGTIDELNAHLGLVAEGLRDATGDLAIIREKVLRIQNELFDLGSQLAVLPEDRRENTPVIHDPDVRRLETEMDEMNTDLPSLKSFILPGGGEVSARIHVARTVCRRAERELYYVLQAEPLDGTELPYLNRLSDWLFVAGRYVSAKSGVEETLWKPGKR